MVSKRLGVGAAGGLLWGVIATAVFLSMFRGFLPAPGQVPLPVAIVLDLLYLPFLLAAGIETAIGHSSPGLAEIVAVTLASGIALGLLVTALIALAGRFGAPQIRAQ
jgi:hypothetical protein